jgi:N-acetylmuramoyl-L-alanine amidase
MKICIDPGHGGSDIGASRPWFGNESEFVLALSQKIHDAIAATGIDVTMTRTDDVNTSWEERRKAAEGCDLVIPIHANAYEDSKVRGLIAFYWARNSNGYEIAEAIANSAPKNLRKLLDKSVVAVGPHAKGWERVTNVVAAYHQTTVFLEVGFISNSEDSILLQQTKIQVGLIGAILCGLSKVR